MRHAATNNATGTDRDEGAAPRTYRVQPGFAEGQRTRPETPEQAERRPDFARGQRTRRRTSS
jgi:hypothetical protein